MNVGPVTGLQDSKDELVLKKRFTSAEADASF
jgi:hypothetical protein